MAAAAAFLQIVGCGPASAPHGETESGTGLAGTESIAGIGAALHSAILLRDPIVRTRAIFSALEPISPASSEGLAAWLDRRLFDLDFVDLALIVQAWTVADPSAAMAWVMDQNAPHFERSLMVALPAYARVDFTAARGALSRALSTVTSSDGVLLKVELVKGGYDAGAPELIDYLVEMGPLPERQTILRQLVRRKLLRESPEAVIDWVDSLSAPDDVNLKYSALLKLGVELPAVDAELAKEWALRAHGDEFDSRLLETVTRGFTWNGRAREAFDWLLGLQEQEHASQALAFAFGAWLKQDPAGASAWIRGATHDGRSDPALRQYGLSVLESDGPEMALAWIERIRNPAERERGRFQYARRWFGFDPDAAREWVEGQDFDETTRSQIVAAHARHGSGPDQPERRP